jgi:hypothetical protein
METDTKKIRFFFFDKNGPCKSPAYLRWKCVDPTTGEHEVTGGMHVMTKFDFVTVLSGDEVKKETNTEIKETK